MLDLGESDADSKPAPCVRARLLAARRAEPRPTRIAAAARRSTLGRRRSLSRYPDEVAVPRSDHGNLKTAACAITAQRAARRAQRSDGLLAVRAESRPPNSFRQVHCASVKPCTGRARLSANVPVSRADSRSDCTAKTTARSQCHEAPFRGDDRRLPGCHEARSRTSLVAIETTPTEDVTSHQTARDGSMCECHRHKPGSHPKCTLARTASGTHARQALRRLSRTGAGECPGPRRTAPSWLSHLPSAARRQERDAKLPYLSRQRGAQGSDGEDRSAS